MLRSLAGNGLCSRSPPPWGRSGLTYISYPLICVPRDPSYLRFREPPLARLISASSFRNVFPKGSSRDSRNPPTLPLPPPPSMRETNETRESPLLLLLPSSRARRFAANSFSAEMKEKLRGGPRGGNFFTNVRLPGFRLYERFLRECAKP